MSEITMPPLTEVELPPQGCWVAFRADRRLYVLRADPGDSWTVLDEGGKPRGTLRLSGRGFRAWGDQALGRVESDWRDVVRRFC